MKIMRAGDSSLFIETGNTISSDISTLNRSIIEEVRKLKPVGITECVASYTGVMIYYDPLVTTYEETSSIAEKAADAVPVVEVPDSEGICVPVAYGGEYGPDLFTVAELNQLSSGEVADIHSKGEYIVHMLGFTPGFPYLGGMDKRISAPRKAEPALHIEAGSVGIAGDQTGIYPVESPGGWQIIGRTPLVLFDPQRKPEFLFRAGMRIRFRPVDNYEFWFICEMINNGEYKLEIL
jgi:inhibitor of KinA